MPRRRRAAFQAAMPSEVVTLAPAAIRVCDPPCPCSGCRAVQAQVQRELNAQNCRDRNGGDVREAAVWFARNMVRVMRDGRIAIMVRPLRTDRAREVDVYGDYVEDDIPATLGSGLVARVSDRVGRGPDVWTEDAVPMLDEFMRQYLTESYDPNPENRFTPDLQTYGIIALQLRDYAASHAPSAMVGCMNAIIRHAASLNDITRPTNQARSKELRDALTHHGMVLGDHPCQARAKKRQKGLRTIHGAVRGPMVGVLPSRILREAHSSDERVVAKPPAMITCSGFNACRGTTTRLAELGTPDIRCVYHNDVATGLYNEWYGYLQDESPENFASILEGAITVIRDRENWPTVAMTREEFAALHPPPPLASPLPQSCTLPLGRTPW